MTRGPLQLIRVKSPIFGGLLPGEWWRVTDGPNKGASTNSEPTSPVLQSENEWKLVVRVACGTKTKRALPHREIKAIATATGPFGLGENANRESTMWCLRKNTEQTSVLDFAKLLDTDTPLFCRSQTLAVPTSSSLGTYSIFSSATGTRGGQETRTRLYHRETPTKVRSQTPLVR